MALRKRLPKHQSARALLSVIRDFDQQVDLASALVHERDPYEAGREGGCGCGRIYTTAAGDGGQDSENESQHAEGTTVGALRPPPLPLPPRGGSRPPPRPSRAV